MELEDDTSFSAGERSTSFHSHEPILPLIFEDTEISDSLSNWNGKVNAATSTLPRKRCMGYVSKEITSSVWTSFPFQALPLEKNQNFYFENGRFHSGECYKDHYILSNRDLDSNIHCQNLIDSIRLKHLVHRGLNSVPHPMNHQFLSHDQLLTRVSEKEEKIKSLTLSMDYLYLPTYLSIYKYSMDYLYISIYLSISTPWTTYIYLSIYL